MWSGFGRPLRGRRSEKRKPAAGDTKRSCGSRRSVSVRQTTDCVSMMTEKCRRNGSGSRRPAGLSPIPQSWRNSSTSPSTSGARRSA